MASDGFTRSKGYPVESPSYQYFVDVDDDRGGNSIVANLNERRPLDNLVAQVPCCYAEDCQTISGEGTPTDF
jgi:hypothetical protein